jgi:hypothetical protein
MTNDTIADRCPSNPHYWTLHNRLLEHAGAKGFMMRYLFDGDRPRGYDRVDPTAPGFLFFDEGSGPRDFDPFLLKVCIDSCWDTVVFTDISEEWDVDPEKLIRMATSRQRMIGIIMTVPGHLDSWLQYLNKLGKINSIKRYHWDGL